MTELRRQKDLIVLTADQDIAFSIRGLFSRTQALEIRQLKIDIFVHPEHDPGCLLGAHDFLRPFVNRYSHALVILDREGCGRGHLSRDLLENELETRLCQSGWNDRAAGIVIDPELEMWVWSDSPHVDTVLGWRERQPALRNWLRTQGFVNADGVKPNRPKEAMRSALRLVSKIPSSSLYLELAQKVSFGHCVDHAFLKLKTTLKYWFSDDSKNQKAESPS